MKLSDYVVDHFQSATCVGHVFTLTGGMTMHLVDSVGRHPLIKVIPMHHEQAAGIAANAYGRIKNTAGFVLVTAGPGALNAVTPCAGAWMESNPMVFLSGQVSRANGIQGLPLRQRGIQEVDIVQVVKTVTKYSVRVTDPTTIRYHVERAIHEAFSGRPGPVWLDIPVDVQAAEIDPVSQHGFVASKQNAAAMHLDKIVSLLKSAKRPLVVLGQGVRLAGAAESVESFIRTLNIPVQTTWNGMDLLAENHELFAGRANVFGPRYANLIIQNADVILSIGARLGMQHTGYNVGAFGRGAHVVMVDVDVEESRKPGLKVETFVHADAAVFMKGLSAKWVDSERSAWVEWKKYCSSVRQQFPEAQTLRALDPAEMVQPHSFIRSLGENLPSDSLFMIGSSGMGHTVAGSVYPVKSGQRAFTFKGLAGMGYGVPSAIGAALASPGKPVVTLVGEGGLQLNLQDLQTISHFKLPVTVIVFNNGGYHSIHMTQKGYFGGHFVGSGPESDVTFPELSSVAKLYGFKYSKIENNGQVLERLTQHNWLGGPAFLEVMIDPDKGLDPKIISYKREDGTMESRPIEDMGPLLNRDVLKKWMYIPLHNDNK